VILTLTLTLTLTLNIFSTYASHCENPDVVRLFVTHHIISYHSLTMESEDATLEAVNLNKKMKMMRTMTGCEDPSEEDFMTAME
jgi:hypothetical protein